MRGNPPYTRTKKTQQEPTTTETYDVTKSSRVGSVRSVYFIETSQPVRSGHHPTDWRHCIHRNRGRYLYIDCYSLTTCSMGFLRHASYQVINSREELLQDRRRIRLAVADNQINCGYILSFAKTPSGAK